MLFSEALFNFTDDQLQTVPGIARLVDNKRLQCPTSRTHTCVHMRTRAYARTLSQAEEAGAATTFCVDGRVAVEKNPVRFINAARSKELLAGHVNIAELATRHLK